MSEKYWSTLKEGNSRVVDYLSVWRGLTHAHTHIQVTCEIHAHAHTAIVYYDSLQLTSSMHEAKDKGHRVHGQKEIMHVYGLKSTPKLKGWWQT